jgi:assimilatory nitrate reductase catalytic subunit
LFVPIHWTDQFAAQARVDTLIPGLADPHSGQPALKHVPARIERFPASFYGFAVLRERPPHLDADYWAFAKCEGGWRLELAFAAADRDWRDFAMALFGCGDGPEMLSYLDETAGLRRFACFNDTRLLGALFLGPMPVAASRNWAVEQLSTEHDSRRARLAVIVGRPGRDRVDPGATVCSCFGVGANQIAAAVRQGCATVAAIGVAIQAGTNCGSCRAEIRGIIEAHRHQGASARTAAL